MKKHHAQAFVDVAFRFSELSKCKRLKVGCICVKNGAIIGIGWNGLPEGIENDACEDENNSTKHECSHAEDNMLIKLAGSTESVNGSTVFLTHMPCFLCSSKLKLAGVKSVVYKHDYRCKKGVEYLLKNGVEVVKWEDQG